MYTLTQLERKLEITRPQHWGDCRCGYETSFKGSQKGDQGSPFLQQADRLRPVGPLEVSALTETWKVWAGLCSAGFSDRESLTLAFLTKI